MQEQIIRVAKQLLSSPTVKHAAAHALIHATEQVKKVLKDRK